jgi:hypothetical protein
VLVILSMRVLLVSMGMAMTTKDEETDKVRGQTETSHDEDELRVLDLGRVDEPG